jgi:hypothetical protein
MITQNIIIGMLWEKMLDSLCFSNFLLWETKWIFLSWRYDIILFHHVFQIFTTKLPNRKITEISILNFYNVYISTFFHHSPTCNFAKKFSNSKIPKHSRIHCTLLTKNIISLNFQISSHRLSKNPHCNHKWSTTCRNLRRTPLFSHIKCRPIVDWSRRVGFHRNRRATTHWEPT